MRTSLKALLLVVAVSALAWAGPQGKGNRNKGWNGPNYSAGYYRIPQPDVIIVRDYYRGVRLPRGLQKKLARGGQLPPGWQRRVRPVPVVIDRRLGPLPYGYRRGLYDGAYVVYDSRRGLLVDFFVSF